MEKFSEAKIEVVKFAKEDIVTASNNPVCATESCNLVGHECSPDSGCQLLS